MFSSTLGRVFGLALAIVAFGSAGCDLPKFDVSGTVTYNGVALDKPDGRIVFVGPKGEQFEASINLDGSYRALQVTKGTYKVVAYYPNPAAKGNKLSKRKPGDPPPPPPGPPAALYLTPEKYASAETTDLSFSVDVKDTVYDVKLTGPPVK